MSEDEAIEIMLDNKKEYERIIKELDDVKDTNGNKPIETIKDCQKFVQAIETILDLYKQEKEKNKELELQLKNSDIERLRDYIKYKIECFENIMNGRLGDGARPDYQRKIDLLNEVLEESY